MMGKRIVVANKSKFGRKASINKLHFYQVFAF